MFVIFLGAVIFYAKYIISDFFSDGIEFFLTPEYSVATKGDKDRFIRTQYFKKVIEAKSGK